MCITFGKQIPRLSSRRKDLEIRLHVACWRDKCRALQVTPWALWKDEVLPVDGRLNPFGDAERLRDSAALLLASLPTFPFVASHYFHCRLLLGWAKVPLGDHCLAVLNITSSNVPNPPSF